MNKINFKLADAFNTHNPALIVIEDMGFSFGIIPDEKSDEESETGIGNWYAIKDDKEFIASDPLSLLGLITIWLKRGINWRSDDDRDLYMEAMSNAYGDE